MLSCTEEINSQATIFSLVEKKENSELKCWTQSVRKRTTKF